MKASIDEFMGANLGLIHKVVQKAMPRVVATKLPMTYEDLVQDLSIVFLRAYELHDETQTKFSTYFTTAAINRINSLISRHMKDVVNIGTASIERASPDGEEYSLEETIDSGYGTPEQFMEASDLLRRLEAELSPLALQIIELSISPTPEIEREHQALIAYSERARSEGEVVGNVPRHITP